MSPAPPHRDINQTSMNTTRRQRLRAAPSLQARFAFPALTSVAQASRQTDRHFGDGHMFMVAIASSGLPALPF